MESAESRRLSGVQANLKASAVISSALVLPFMILELVNRRGFHEGFPIPLFSVIWLLPFAFTLILIPTVARLRAGSKRTADRLIILLSLALLILIALVWIGIVVDQMPCFLGVPNCD